MLAVACLVAGTAVGGSAMLRAEANRSSPVAALAEQRAFVTASLRVTSDPVRREGRFASYVLLRGTVTEVTGRGRRYATHVPVLVIAGDPWREAELGSVVRVEGRVAPADGPDLAAVVSTSRDPTVLEPPAGCWTRRRWCGPGSGPRSHRPGPRRRRSSPRWSSATTGGCRRAWWRASRSPG